MGFLSSLWKGIKKTVKKIFKPIKNVFKKVGKFMNKIGIVGQLAMSFILPGIGNALIAGFGTATSALAGGALGSIGKAAGWVLGKAGTFAKTLSTGFKTVTGAVTDFIGTTAKYVGNKLNITNFQGVDTLSQAFGKEGFGGRLTDSFTKLGKEASNFWNSTTADFADRGIMTADQKLAFDQKKELMEFGEGVSEDMKAQQKARGADANFRIDADGNRIDNINTELLSEKVAESEQGLFSKGFEKITGEQTVGDFISNAPGKAKDYAVDSLLAAPGNIVKSTFKEGLSNLVGLGPEEYDQGPSWRANNPYAYQSGYARSQQESAAPMSFESFAQQNMAFYNTDPRGAYGGSENYGAYMQRFGTGG